MLVKLLVDAGDMKPGPTISQKLGPLGINIGKIIEDINKSTQNFKGMKVPVVLDINTKTKNFNIEVLSPPVTELLKKSINVEKGSGTPNKVKIANVSLEEVVAVTKIKQQKMLAKDFKRALKTVLGSCITLGILVENKDPREITKELDKNKEYKEIVEKQKTDVSEDKRGKLQKYFEQVKARQEEQLKKEAEAAATKEAEKAATAAPAAGTTKKEEAKSTEAKIKEETKKG